MADTVKMKSPGGEERDIPKAGVAAMKSLRWEEVQKTSSTEESREESKRPVRKSSK